MRTTPTQMEKLLRDYLDELNDEVFREFKWHLSRNEINGSQDVDLQDASRAASVDQLVEAYGEDNAADIMVDIFYQMKLNDLAVKLTQGKISHYIAL